MDTNHLNPFLKSRYQIELPVDLYKFKSSYCNIFLLVNEGKGILVDAGKKSRAKAFLSFVSQLGIKPEDITYILLTHTHNDHTGALKEISSNCKSKVVVHSNESENLRYGYTRAPLGTGPFTSFISFLGRKVAPSNLSYPAVTPDIILDRDSLDLSPWYLTWKYTPGHTDGSVTYIIDGKVALPGDALFGMQKNDCFPSFANNLEDLKKSWALLLDSDVSLYLPAHGSPVTKEILEHSYQKHMG